MKDFKTNIINHISFSCTENFNVKRGKVIRLALGIVFLVLNASVLLDFRHGFFKPIVLGILLILFLVYFFYINIIEEKALQNTKPFLF